ncbi:hypothetical protein BCR42DRAFT_443253 [Absidia repens]|uniref:Uncharacterized protein n=1 Tax=Absidia repens TaxID=90262 RepID=A0A1X2I1N2_9FUNG|nr:hypothetical protein BCR42DRAFT_443253 [Absidia repens]
MSMDWIGSVGYIFSVSQHEDIFVARHVADLRYPLYVANFDEFLETLDALFIWKLFFLFLSLSGNTIIS